MIESRWGQIFFRTISNVSNQNLRSRLSVPSKSHKPFLPLNKKQLNVETVQSDLTSSSRCRILNLCGSSVSLEPVKAVLLNCAHLHSINLQSCRALPRGIKRLYTGSTVAELRTSFQERPKTESGENGDESPPSESPFAV